MDKIGFWAEQECRKIKKAQKAKLFSMTATTHVEDLQKTIKEEVMSKMDEMVDKKVCEKLKR